MPRTLKLAFKSFQISNFSGGACPQTPLAKGASRPLVDTVAYSNQTGCLLQTLLKPLFTRIKQYRKFLASAEKWISLIFLLQVGLCEKQIPVYLFWLNIDLFSRKSIILENRHIATFGAKHLCRVSSLRVEK